MKNAVLLLVNPVAAPWRAPRFPARFAVGSGVINKVGGRLLLIVLSLITAVAIGLGGYAFYKSATAADPNAERCTQASGKAAIDACTAILKAGDQAAARIQRGNAYAAINRTAEALEDYDAALQLAPQSSQAHNNRGLIYYRLGQYDSALADYDAAIRLVPQDAKALVNRGKVYVAMDSFTLAIKDYDAALRIKPANAFALLQRGRSYAALHRYGLAIRDYDAAARLEPDNLNIVASRGSAYGGLGQYRRGLADLNRVVGRYPQAVSFNNRCWMRANWGQELDLALADCNEALRQKPGYAPYLDSRALVYLRMEKYADAIGDAHAALAGNPNMPTSLYILGVARLKTGDEKNGNADIAAAVQIDPTIPAMFAKWGVKP